MVARLAQTPRIFVLALVMTISGTTLGAREVTRLVIINSLVSSEWGVSAVATVIAVFAAIGAVVAGRLVDRWDPRYFVYGALLIGAVTSVVTAILVSTGSLSVPAFLATTAVDAVSVGLGLPSMLKVQALIVRHDAVGGAEMLNVLRIGIGSVVGVLIASALNNVVVILVASGVSLVICAGLVSLVLSPVKPRPRALGDQAARSRLFEYLSSSPSMRRLITVDLALTFVIPTQLVNLVLIGGGYAELIGICVAAGMVGVLLGRIALLGFGFRGNPSHIVLTATLGLAVCQIVTVFLLANDWIMGVPWLLVADIAIATILLTYAQGLLAALVQQNVAESVRGRLSGSLGACRAILVSIAALVAAEISSVFGPQILLIVLVSSLMVVVIAAKGFRGVAVTQA